MTTVIPESASLSSVSDGGVSDDQSLESFPCSPKKDCSIQNHPEEPNLHMIPSDLSPFYGPLPYSMKVLVLTVCILSSAVILHQSILNHVLNDDGDDVIIINIWTVIGLLVNTLLFCLVQQELLTPPSRVTIDELIEKYTLPSIFSRYERLSIPYSRHQPKMEQGVHYLQCDAPSTQQKSNYLFRAIYANHGFGANCLAWLPVLPQLVERLKAKVAVAHDATGFGLTDRSKRDPNLSLADNLSPYTFAGSSRIGTTLLENVTTSSSSPEESNNDDLPVILMGQSVGCITTLHMAASMPQSTKKWVILVSPALGVIPTYVAKPGSSLGTTTSWNWVETIVNSCSVVGRYVLRRLVGTNNLVRLILGQVWADTNNLSDSTVLGNQWPTICSGWEDGMLTIGRAILQPVPIKDAPLLEQVLLDKNTTVTVVLGTKDKIVGKRHIRKFMEPYKGQLRIVEMEGVGHCPAEEDVDRFLKIVEDVFEKDKEQILGKN